MSEETPKRKFTKSWIKLFIDELDDPVINLLSPPAFKLLHQLRLLTARLGHDEGKSMNISHAIWALRMPATDASRQLFDELVFNRLITISTKDGCIRLTGFEEQQAPMSPAERQRRSRKAKKYAGIPTEKDVLDDVIDVNDLPANYANMIAMLSPAHPMVAEMERAVMQVVMDKTSYAKIRSAANVAVGLDDVTPEQIIAWYSGEDSYWYTVAIGKDKDEPPYAKNVETTLIGARRHHLKALKAQHEAKKKDAPVKSGGYKG